MGLSMMVTIVATVGLGHNEGTPPPKPNVSQEAPQEETINKKPEKNIFPCQFSF